MTVGAGLAVCNNEDIALGAIGELRLASGAVVERISCIRCRVIGVGVLRSGPTEEGRLPRKIKYSPCIHLGFESICSENRCMRAIEVTEVMEAFDQMARL